MRRAVVPDIYDYLIVGSGLFGAVFAYEAEKRGKRCLVLEKRAEMGGNLFCQEIEGITVHTYGAHIFHTNKKWIWEYVNRLVSFHPFINSPIANYKGELYNLPFNMNTFYAMWKTVTPIAAQKKIREQRVEITSTPENLEEQAISLVGRDIYEKLVKGYTEKQWGRDCKELPAFIIRRLPVRFTYDNNYFTDPYQGIPVGGYNALITAFLKNVDVLCNVDYNLVREKYRKKAKKILYTGMLDAYFDYKLGALEYRSLKFETEVLGKENLQGVAVMNFTDRETPYTRRIEHKHFAFGEQEKTVVTKEYPAAYKKGLEPYYPINDAKNNALYEKYQVLAKKEENILFGGRLAEYKYYDMDQTIASAIGLIKKEFNEE